MSNGVDEQGKLTHSQDVVRWICGVAHREENMGEQAAMCHETLRREREPRGERDGSVSGNGSRTGQDQATHSGGMPGCIFMCQISAERVATESELSKRKRVEPGNERGKEKLDGMVDLLTPKRGAGGAAPAGKVWGKDGGVAHV